MILHKKVLFVVALVAMLVLGVSTVLAVYPDSERGVTPVFYNDGPGGNVECDQVGDYVYESERFDEGDQYSGSVGPITWTTTDNKFVNWTGVHGGLAVILKGGPGAHVYTYDSSYEWDNDLASPLNPGGQIPNLSNITFCWNPPADNGGEWCSPGYWRQEHHLDSWPAGISRDDPYPGAVTLSKQGERAGASTTPTLWEVLQSPQWYGGDAFNAVGDLLSAAHPDVNFNGERVEDSCPLN